MCMMRMRTHQGEAFKRVRARGGRERSVLRKCETLKQNTKTRLMPPSKTIPSPAPFLKILVHKLVSMKISYEFTLEACNIYVKETFFIKKLFLYFLKDNIRRALICALLLSLGFACLFYSFNIALIVVLFIVIFLSEYIIWGLMSYFSGGKYVYRLLDGFDKNYELIVENDIIRRRSGSGEVSFTWNNVKDIYNTKKNILIFVSDRQALIIPKRVFNSEQEINDFWHLVSSCYQRTNSK